MKRTVKVTKQDIKSGLVRSAWHCPIAKALCRAFKLPNGSVGVCASSFSFYSTQENRRKGVNESSGINFNNEKVRQFVINFDFPSTRSTVKPFSFKVEVPDSVIKEVPHLFPPKTKVSSRKRRTRKDHR